MLWRLLCLTLVCNLQVIKNEAAYMNYPMRSDFAECELNTEEKERFLDLHNKLRGIVNPTAADMEYLVRENERIFVLVNFPRLRLRYSVQFFMASQSRAVAKQVALVTPMCCEVFAAKVLPKELIRVLFSASVLATLVRIVQVLRSQRLTFSGTDAINQCKVPLTLCDHRKRMYRNAQMDLTLAYLSSSFSLDLG